MKNGDTVNWVGLADLFCTPVIIVRASALHVTGCPDKITYDIADPKTGKILLYAATEKELRSI